MPDSKSIDESIVQASDKKFSYGFFNKKTKFNQNAKLFPSGSPAYTDIKQGYTDLDCYFLSVVAGIAKDKPEKLLKCFPEYENLEEDDRNKKFSKAKTVKITFYKVEYSSGAYRPDGKVTIVVDKTALRGKGVPWVRLLEKAYSVYRTRGYDAACTVEEYNEKKSKIKSRIIDGLKGGDSASVIVTLTGNISHSIDFEDDEERDKVVKFTNYSAKVQKIFNDIQAALRSNNVVTASASRGNKFYSKGLFLQHCYTVIDAYENDGFKYVVVRNPYANRSRVYEKDSKGVRHSKVKVYEDENKKGVSALELNDFFKYFRSVEYGSIED